ncbi:MAG: hypothetical protein M3N95_11495 [Actinomycetota bacterium]|nr:hypothetical protein [Actinomycetota bacterium]
MSDPFNTTTQMPAYGSSDTPPSTGSAPAGSGPGVAPGSSPGTGGSPSASGSPVADKTSEMTDGGQGAEDLKDRAEDVKDKAAEAASAGKQAVGDVAETVVEKAQDVAQEASRQARDLVGEAKSQVSQQVGDQHQKLVSGLRSLSDELATMGRSNEQPGLAAEVALQAHSRVRTAADWLEDRDPRDLLNEVRSLARRRPGSFLLGAALAGVLAGRMTRGAVAVHAEDSHASAPAAATQNPPTSAVAPIGAPLTGVSVPPSVLDTEVIGYGSPPGQSPVGDAAGYGSFPPASDELGGHNGGGLAGGVAP